MRLSAALCKGNDRSASHVNVDMTQAAALTKDK